MPARSQSAVLLTLSCRRENRAFITLELAEVTTNKAETAVLLLRKTRKNASRAQVTQ
jgi:hypothetical protein